MPAVRTGPPAEPPPSRRTGPRRRTASASTTTAGTPSGAATTQPAPASGSWRTRSGTPVARRAAAEPVGHPRRSSRRPSGCRRRGCPARPSAAAQGLPRVPSSDPVQRPGRPAGPARRRNARGHGPGGRPPSGGGRRRTSWPASRRARRAGRSGRTCPTIGEATTRTRMRELAVRGRRQRPQKIPGHPRRMPPAARLLEGVLGPREDAAADVVGVLPAPRAAARRAGRRTS